MAPSSLYSASDKRRDAAVTEVTETRLQLCFGFSLESLAVGHGDFAMAHPD